MKGIFLPKDYPKISVIVPCYNHVTFIEGTLQSILNQGYPNLELIVIDGGSDDGSVEIIERYAQHLDYWVSERDEGQTHALIKGFSHATGDIQCWLNSDDQHEPSTLAEVADYFESHPDVDAVFGDTTWIDTDGNALRIQREIPFNRFIWLYTYNYVMGMSMFWRRSLYETVGGLDANFNLAMDADLWIRFSHVGRIQHVRRLWSRMRFYPEMKTVRLGRAGSQEDWTIRLREWGGEPSLFELKRRIARCLRILWRFFSGCYYLGYQPKLVTREHYSRD